MLRSLTIAERELLLKELSDLRDIDLAISERVIAAAAKHGILEMKGAKIFGLDEFPGLLAFRNIGDRNVHLRRGPNGKGLCGRPAKKIVGVTPSESGSVCSRCVAIAEKKTKTTKAKKN